MNDSTAGIIRQQIKDALELLPEKNFAFFKRMYSHKDQTLNISDTVDGMDDDNLERALDQCEGTLAKL